MGLHIAETTEGGEVAFAIWQ